MGASERAARLVRQLLAFSRKQVLEPQVVDLNAVVSDTARMLRPLLGEDVEVVTCLRSARGRVRVDPAQIDQVLVNLAVNARDAMPGGGSLFLETEDAEEGTAPGGALVALTVRDTGHGMDERTRSQAFEPFFTTKSGSGGTGLGLSMVYGIVQQSGGQITVESEPGRGTAFRILLPCADGPGAPEEAGPAAPPPSRGGETVLVVEDEPVIRSLACEMLEAHGYCTLEATSGEEALGLAVRHPGPIDLLLTDVVMPGGMTGCDLAAIARRRRPGVRVLYVSGYPLESIVGRAHFDAADELLAKPYANAALASKLREVLDRE
jgi:CheY-like chemotaxis protein